MFQLRRVVSDPFFRRDAGDCSDHSSIWFSFERRELAASFHTLESDTTSFLSLDECKELCVSYNTSADYYRDYQCSGASIKF